MQTPAWRIGVETARKLRDQERLEGPISNVRLSEMFGVSSDALQEREPSGMAFELDDSIRNSRVVLRSKWEASRRFQLARLLADRLFSREDEALHPATASYTYRQKLQRAFAVQSVDGGQAIQ